ncbi:enoyl-CoA hydratase-related protein [Aliikangiella sp. IMCC44359]|uniref:enoyl-CoA hydratase-related protein n=1 Tax=Aliikangiella sp. IMCC44359 TaxID=3459125 RepID=UPI00403AC4C9
MTIKIEKNGRVIIATLNRPKALNALNSEVMHELALHLKKFDSDDDIGCFVIKGSERVFAAGADIKEMGNKSFSDMTREDFFSGWSDFTALKTPKIASVSGYAYGGGCELAMMCDIILAGESATFSQPEIKLGVIPGIGGTQRLSHLVGKSKAMEMILTGRIINAFEAEKMGLVSRVYSDTDLFKETLSTAHTIASYGKAAVIAAKECVDRSMEMSLAEGILFERRVFHSLFATQDQKEGMQAFIEKRSPIFSNQ